MKWLNWLPNHRMCTLGQQPTQWKMTTMWMKQQRHRIPLNRLASRRHWNLKGRWRLPKVSRQQQRRRQQQQQNRLRSRRRRRQRQRRKLRRHQTGMNCARICAESAKAGHCAIATYRRSSERCRVCWVNPTYTGRRWATVIRSILCRSSLNHFSSWFEYNFCDNNICSIIRI